MDGEGYARGLVRFLKAVLIAEFVLFAIVGLVYWLNGWQTVYQYGQGLILGGIVAIGIGVLNLSYHWFKHLGDYTGAGYIADLILDRYRLKLKEKAIKEHIKEEIKDPGSSYSFFLLMAIVGVIAIAVGALIQKIF